MQRPNSIPLGVLSVLCGENSLHPIYTAPVTDSKMGREASKIVGVHEVTGLFS